MDEREARAKGLIDTLELPPTVEVDHWLVIPVMALKRGGLKEDEATYTRPGGQAFKLFHPWDVKLEQLAQEAVRETLERLRQQEREEAGNPL